MHLWDLWVHRDWGYKMKFTEYVFMAALLVPTVSLVAGVVISITAPANMPPEVGVHPTSLAVYYADMEKQP